LGRSATAKIKAFTLLRFFKIKSFFFSSLDLDLFNMGGWATLLFSETSAMANPATQRCCGEEDYLTKRVYL